MIPVQYLWLCLVCNGYFNVGTSHQHDDGTWMNEAALKNMIERRFQEDVLAKLDDIITLLRLK